MWIALALPDDGRIIACDVSKEWASIARRHWDEAGISNKVDPWLAPALKTLDQLTSDAKAGSFDFVFIDADKSNYWNYFERALPLLRSVGLIAVDNTLWSGRVADSNDRESDTEAIRTFNAKIYHDARVSISLVPIGDGLTLARKI
jgi:predicted O-methyltransferase YrrM